MSLLTRNTLLTNYSKSEELTNSLSSAIGIILGIVGLSVIVPKVAGKADLWRSFSLGIFFATAVILYLMSTLYHCIPSKRLKYVFQTADHIAIYLFVVGTYTALTLVSLRAGWNWSLFGIRGRWDWGLFSVILGLTLVGIIIKVFLQKRLYSMFILLNIIMGWFIIIALKPIFANIPNASVLWLYMGTNAYVLGYVLFSSEKIPHNHALWHLFVLAGSICHFMAIFNI